MSTATKTGITTITIKNETAMQWIDEYICVERKQWTNNEDTGELAFIVSTIFAPELLDAMTDDLVENVDFSVANE
jgi:hypothetical protein